MLQEALGGNDLDVLFLDILFADEAFDPTEVVNVGVRINDSLDVSVAAPMFLIEGECSSTGLQRSEGIDDNDALVALNDGRVREVESTHLVDGPGDMI